MQNNKYKTKLCRNFTESGQCLKGDNCIFAHGDQELRQSQFPQQGFQQQGFQQQGYDQPRFQQNNNFGYNQGFQQQNKYKTQMCKNFEQTGACQYESRCKFAHGEQEMRQPQQFQSYQPGFQQQYQMPNLGFNFNDRQQFDYQQNFYQQSGEQQDGNQDFQPQE